MSPTFEPTPGKILVTMHRTVPGAREECLDASNHIVKTVPWLFPRGASLPAHIPPHPLDPYMPALGSCGGQVDRCRPCYVWYGPVAAIHLLAGVGAPVPQPRCWRGMWGCAWGVGGTWPGWLGDPPHCFGGYHQVLGHLVRTTPHGASGSNGPECSWKKWLSQHSNTSPCPRPLDGVPLCHGRLPPDYRV